MHVFVKKYIQVAPPYVAGNGGDFPPRKAGLPGVFSCVCISAPTGLPPKTVFLATHITLLRS